MYQRRPRALGLLGVLFVRLPATSFGATMVDQHRCEGVPFGESRDLHLHLACTLRPRAQRERHRRLQVQKHGGQPTKIVVISITLNLGILVVKCDLINRILGESAS